MNRICAALLLLAVLALSACASTLITSEEDTNMFDNLVPRPIQRDEDIKRLTVINEEDINWSGNRETRIISINNYIVADEFHKIAELVIANGYVDVHGTLFGTLPSYFFGGLQVLLIPCSRRWHLQDASDEAIEISGLDIRASIQRDSLRIHSYIIYRDADSLVNPTDTINNFTLVTHHTDTGITDEQILMQFISYLNGIRAMIYCFDERRQIQELPNTKSFEEMPTVFDLFREVLASEQKFYLQPS